MTALFRRAAAPSVVLLAVASSAIGIFNGFTYDDVYVVEPIVTVFQCAPRSALIATLTEPVELSVYVTYT